MNKVGIAIIFLLSGSLVGSWIPFGERKEDETKVSLIRSNSQEVVIDVEIPGITYEYLNTKEGIFTRLSGGTGITGSIGKPELPTLAKLVEIPQDAEVTIDLQDIEAEEYTLSELGILHPIYPVQPPIPKIPGALENIKFEIDRASYQSDRFFPENVYEFGDIGTIRGTRLIPLNINLIQYNPEKNKIKVIKKVRIRLILSGSDLAYTQWKKERYYSPYFDGVLREAVINYEPAKGVPQLPIGYLIITDDSFYNNILPFASWKGKKGFNVTVTRTSDLGGASIANIRSYIENAYNTWDIPPTFCLLVGDVEQIPASQTGSETEKVTDLYYFTVDGSDYFPDIYYGRFSGFDTSHIDAMVDKIVEYERNLWIEETGWLGKMYFMTTNDGDRHHEVELICNLCIALARANNIVCDSLYYYYGTGTPIATAINDGRTLALYTGHGNTIAWGGPPFFRSAVNALINNDKYPFVVGHACNTGNFDVSECFAETWTRVENKGAIAYFGSAPLSWWVWDDTLQIGWFRPMFIEPTVNFLGGITQLGLHNVWEWQYSSDPTGVKYYYEAYHIFGDPSMDLYTLDPTALTVSYPGIFPLGSSTFTVNVAEDSALVALYMDSTLHGGAYSNGGEAVVSLDPLPTEEGIMHITITKHNYITYEDSIPAIIPASVTIEPDTISVNTPTWVCITVRDNELQPMPDVELMISSYGIMPPLVDTTNSSGLCSLKVNPPYGEVLTVTGRMISEQWMLFTESLWVTGASNFTFTSLSISVPLLGITDTLAPSYEGVIDVSISPSGFDLFVSGCGIDTSAYYDGGDGEMVVVPVTSGEVTICIAKEGYNIEEVFYPVKEFYGMLSGTVTDSVNSTPIVGALVRIYDAPTRTLVFEDKTNDSGVYIVPDSLPVDYYDMEVTSFGYEDYSDTFMLFIGEKVKDVKLVPGERVMLSGVVNLKDTGNNLGVTVEARYEDYIFFTTDDDRGNYTLNLPPEVLYTVRAYKEGYTEDRKEGVSVPQADVNFTLYPVTTLYFSDFEEDKGGITGTFDWQWGIPTTGPQTAYSGEKLWATKLDNNYSDNSDSKLTTPEIFLPDVSYIELSFWHWYSIEDYYDGGNVKLSNGDTFVVIEPVAGYPEDRVSDGNCGIPGEPAYSAESDGLKKAIFDITSYAGNTIKLRFHFGSDTWLVEPGWYVDDIWIGYVDSVSIHDVGVLSILLPDSVYQDSTYTPLASLYNYGVSEPPFLVICSIGDYIDTIFADVAPDTKVEVHFGEWIPSMADTTLTARVEAILNEDGAPNNNIMEQEVNIIPTTHITPTAYVLYQNTPNPFSDVTTIEYTIPEKDNFSLEIYNVLGQRVCVLESGEKEAGFYYVKWDGRDSKGMRVPSGVYFVRFSAGDFHSIKKIIKIR